MTRPAESLPVLRDGPAEGLGCGSCGACCVLPAVVSLGKPMHRACDHLRHDGCGIYGSRPDECRRFHCLWLQGALGSDRALRPDQLGVMFDAYHPRTDEASLSIAGNPPRPRLVALELWSGALDDPEVSRVLAPWGEVEVLHRDGRRERRVFAGPG